MRNQFSDEKKEYKPKVNIPEKISDIIKPVFGHEDHGSEELLQKCLHGATQNVNESLNNLIWQKCSKLVYVGKRALEFGVNSAVINFNKVNIGLLPAYTKLNIQPSSQKSRITSKIEANKEQ